MPKAKITLKGSCLCGAVQFKLKSAQVYPYQRCYRSICRTPSHNRLKLTNKN